MSVTIDSVFQEALQLTEESRMSLVERLIVSSSSYNSIEQEQIEAAKSRLQEMHSGAVQGVSVEDVLQRVRDSLKTLPPQ
jgi:hypothetical protein